MPQGDRTGPNGQGSMTGRGMGYCNGYNSPGFTRGMPMGRGFGYSRGFGFRRGFGRGFRRIPVRAVPQEFVPVRQYTKEEEIQNLKNELNILEQEKKDINQELEEVKKRIETIEKE
ncbi:DUF5320 domain-containing protein [Candidatus Woesearchaeota archaeon]|nr:DUF5320 domain-containing protein [Candidatus Woesearchaeota archaeon]